MNETNQNEQGRIRVVKRERTEVQVESDKVRLRAYRRGLTAAAKLELATQRRQRRTRKLGTPTELQR